MGEFNISFSHVKTNNSSTAASYNVKQTSESDVSIFSLDSRSGDDKKVLTKEEKKAQKEAEKAEHKRIANEPDGIIQGGKQGSDAGDCWLLAQMNSISKTDWGKKALSEAITKDDKGNYVVHFKGVDKDIKITQKEFNKAQKSSNYSKGDADALLYELAVERHFKDANLNKGTIRGNNLAGEDSLQYLLTGNMGKETDQLQTMEIILKEMGKNPDNNNNISATYVYLDTHPDNVEDMNHAMSVQRVILDEKGEIDKVVVLNSYTPNKPETISYKQFKNNNIKMFGYVMQKK